MIDYSDYNEVDDTTLARPHVVILGAGASRATCPNGDVTGQILPLMGDFLTCTGLRGELKARGIESVPDNIEPYLDELLSAGKHQIVSFIASFIFNYFSPMGLPGAPTVYDHLVLSLRSKDLIATFNWDPLLFYALARNRRVARLPKVAFLHGNTAIGYCLECWQMAHRNSNCPKCGKPLEPSKLMMPTPNKRYDSDSFVKREWRKVRSYLKEAYMLTIFGYSAPDSDALATDLLCSEWTASQVRSLSEVEVINPISEDYARERFSKYIFSNHWKYTDNFYNSWMAKHPRRTCEALWAETMEGVFFNDSSFPKNEAWEELYDFFQPYFETEDSQ